MPVGPSPDDFVESGDPLSGQAYLDLIARRDIQPLPAANGPEANPLHLFIIQPYWLQRRHNGNFPRSAHSEVYIPYFSNLRDRGIFPGNNPTALSWQPVFTRQFIRRANHNAVRGKG